MEKTKKNEYISPYVEVNQVILDSNIALQSPVNNITVEAWELDEELIPDTKDIFLAI